MAAGFEAQATHLVGGSMTYEYLGQQSNGFYRYRVNIRMYRDCRASEVRFDEFIEVGIYHNNTNRSRYRTVTFAKQSETDVSPPNATNCPVLQQVCIREARYSDIIEVPASSVGYHLYFVRCCRNSQNNIIDDEGQTYYAFIPPTLIKNSSPFFTGVPAPFICVNDSTTYLNSAQDPDNDSLVYVLVHPWDGGSDLDPIPTPPAFLQLPIPNVVYRVGHNVNIPFGAQGHIDIDHNNGLTTFYPVRTGRYAVAIEVREYRNGVLISAVRLDAQMIVINCPPNPQPIITSEKGFKIEIDAGESFCFDITGRDPGNENPPQKVTISGRGEIFTGGNNWQGPTATFQTRTDTRIVTSRFCWDTECEQASERPYIFSIEATDDGCPPKSRIENFQIIVKPFKGADTILGDIPCRGQKGFQYRVNGSQGSTFEWSVLGGTLISGQGTDRIIVDWDDVPNGRITLKETNRFGCEGELTVLNVLLRNKPAPASISGKDTVCEFTNGWTYSITPRLGSTYQWFVSGGQLASAANATQITVNWGAGGSGVVKMVERNDGGCTGDTNYFFVWIDKASSGPIIGPASVCPNSKAMEYRLQARFGSSYFWFVSGGTFVGAATGPSVLVNWGNKGTGFIKAFEITKYGCRGDTLTLPILIDHNLQGQLPQGPVMACENDENIVYSVVPARGSTFNWTIEGGTIVRREQYSITVNWGGVGQGKVAVMETSFDTVNNLPCASAVRILDVQINPRPTGTPITGPDKICQQFVPVNYSTVGFPRSRFIWSVNGDTSQITGQGTANVSITWNIPGDFTLKVQEISEFGCEGPEMSMEITVYPRPVTEGIFGDSLLCAPNFNDHKYRVAGFKPSTFNWWTDGAIITSGQGTQEITVNFIRQNIQLVYVQEVSEFGCGGDTLVQGIWVDFPSIDMDVVSVGFPDDRVEMSWELLNAPRYNDRFFIEQSLGTGPESWRVAGNVPPSQTEYVHVGVNAKEASYKYRIRGKDLCDAPIYSEFHRTIRLQGAKKDDDYAVHLWYNRYEGWTDGVMYYELHRSKDFETELSFFKFRGQDTTGFADDGLTSFEHRYRVKAFEMNGKQQISWSNEFVVNFAPLLFVPNAFSPNGDGTNDIFLIKGASIKSFKIEIFNRWGELIFESTDIENSWDGTYRGVPVPEGVYAYMLNFRGFDNRLQVRQGNITLIR